VPGSEHVSPVASAAAYPSSMDAADAAAAAAEGLSATDADEVSAADVVAEPITEMDSDREPASTDIQSDTDAMERPITDKQGTLSQFPACRNIPFCWPFHHYKYVTKPKRG